MRVCDLNNLYVGYNKTENFRILICACDIEEAADIAEQYGEDSQLANDWTIAEFTDINTKFDTDSVITNMWGV